MIHDDDESIEEIRHAAGLSKTEAAALAGVSPLTWRLYEANTEAITPAKRRECKTAVEVMRRRGSRGAA